MRWRQFIGLSFMPAGPGNSVRPTELGWAPPLSRSAATTQCDPSWSTIEDVAEDLVPLLAKFHRDVLLPDVKRVVAETVEASERRLRETRCTVGSTASLAS